MEKENYSMAICILKKVNGQVLGGRCFREACSSIQALLPQSEKWQLSNGFGGSDVILPLLWCLSSEELVRKELVWGG